MIGKLLMFTAVIFATALMIASLWAWQEAPHLAFDADRPDVVAWAVRTTAVAAIALSQAVLLLFVVGRIYRTRGLDIVLRVLTAAVFTVALVSAIVLSLAGR